ncbi:hypothetical protein PUNSTDRAFT_144334 [Punctularia strigosozonata HHB-11173 SS5]|uniref:uncharacterized protein n=1 Tax=Punctularia strigosozonata (strain HHB-11173) TaxID=741275 RepID=UPI0004416AE3|nr:uncharacterized protein PUNSTDRAFT_144334 [Punctularia strigosozonata HHB-11173 SS5]EIN07814.1 hypothetical protein PUNSTDRAFT_144334 [Punctularia strigosozonata HHB-11173 SS5]
MSNDIYYTLFFTGRDDPREGVVIIGEDTKHVCFEFKTPPVSTSPLPPRTTIYRNETQVVGWFDWITTPQLVTLLGQQMHMASLLQQGTTPSARAFYSADAFHTHFEWRKNEQRPTDYDLYMLPGYMQPGHRVAMFRRQIQNTPVGPSHAAFFYTFDNDLWLLEALAALSLNRWLDSIQGY